MSLKNKPVAPTPLAPKTFAERVVQWQRQHGRHDLPWQANNQPYHVLVSELMLQQTQVSTVIPYFNNWLVQFPDIHALANAHEDQVLNAWQGLGYYSRARNLHRAAQYIVAEYSGQLPDAPELLREVPGVGPYTAGAITAFAFDKPAAIVDGNVKRLFARYFGIAGDLASSALNKQLWQLAERYTPTQNNRSYAQGLLDLGATVCKPRQPNCNLCPLQETCNALATDRVDTLPTAKKKKQIPTKQGYFLFSLTSAGVLLEQRPSEGIWPRLWSFPELEQASHKLSEHGSFKHVFSHYRLNALVYSASSASGVERLHNTKVQRVAIEELEHVGLPAPIRKYLDTQLQLLNK